MAIQVAITHKVKPGCERAFKESLREFFQNSLDHHGVLGVHLISPPIGSNTREYGVLRTFTDKHERDEFYRSDLFGRWQKQVAQLTDGERTYRELHGLEAWFRAAEPPARWKMALLTWLGVWPACVCWDFHRTVSLQSSSFSQLCCCRRRHCRLLYLDRYAGAGKASSSLASLTSVGGRVAAYRNKRHAEQVTNVDASNCI